MQYGQRAMENLETSAEPLVRPNRGLMVLLWLWLASWAWGMISFVRNLLICFEALANVNPADKATILAAGISEALREAIPAVVLGATCLLVLGIAKARKRKAPTPETKKGRPLSDAVPFK